MEGSELTMGFCFLIASALQHKEQMKKQHGRDRGGRTCNLAKETACKKQELERVVHSGRMKIFAELQTKHKRYFCAFSYFVGSAAETVLQVADLQNVEHLLDAMDIQSAWMLRGAASLT